MYVKDVMMHNVTVCREDDSLATVAGMMWSHRCGVLPVLDIHGHIAMMITDRDICIALGIRNARASDILVKEVALGGVFTCAPDDAISRALQTMVSQNVRRLPVVSEDGTLAGILSIDDLFRCAEPSPRDSGISYRQVISALKLMLGDRAPGHVRGPAAVAATTH
jgi:CBS domain-containing protein